LKQRFDQSQNKPYFIAFFVFYLNTEAEKNVNQPSVSWIYNSFN